jgi:hypothetical protein
MKGNPMIPVIAIIATTVVGLMVGVEFAGAFVLNPIFASLPADAAQAARVHGGRMLGRLMPFWYVASLILTIALVVLTWGSTSAAAALVAAVLLAVSVIISVAVLVPINNRSLTWTADSRPDNWLEQQKRWDRLHYVRVAIIVAAFVLVAVAVTLR